MKNLIKLFVLAVLVCSCERTEDVPQTFSFEINGESMDFSGDINVREDLLGEISITGKSAGVGYINITIKDALTGDFDESDYNLSTETLKTGYNMYYSDADDNDYFYSSSDANSRFDIKILKFDNKTDGEVSGEFSGYLIGSMLNADTASDTVIIENGKFSTQLSSRINLND
jgi:hypothetical protein